mmetsp:Transcript_30859/g.35633  ORF Transcript_30859/g.35633 Transcript_30859/m.35633 type:complete len:219 (+) Transcript_30859:436-1092(+)
MRRIPKRTKKKAAKSIGSQLRWAGEVALRQDVKETLELYREEVRRSALVLVGCSNAMRGDFFGDDGSSVLTKGDEWLRRVSVIIKRLSYEEVVRVYTNATSIVVEDVQQQTALPEPEIEDNEPVETLEELLDHHEQHVPQILTSRQNPEIEIVPLTPLHLFSSYTILLLSLGLSFGSCLLGSNASFFLSLRLSFGNNTGFFFSFGLGFCFNNCFSFFL